MGFSSLAWPPIGSGKTYDRYEMQAEKRQAVEAIGAYIYNALRRRDGQFKRLPSRLWGLSRKRYERAAPRSFKVERRLRID